MVQVRWSGLIVALCLLAGVAGCRSNVGAAATVDGKRIAESDVAKFVGPAKTNPNTRPLIVNYMIEERLFARALAVKGVSLSEPELRSLQLVATQQILGAQVTTAQEVLPSLVNGLNAIGITSDFAPIVLRAAELEYSFALAVKAANATALAGATRALKIPVTVSPRYGSWNAAEQSIALAPTPDFLTTSPTASASPTSGS